MSGGRFNYIQFKIDDIANEVEEFCNVNSDTYDSNTLDEFWLCARKLREAAIYLNRMDWVISGDDSEKTFHTRLKEDLHDFNN
jgi:hypothetical protein